MCQKSFISERTVVNHLKNCPSNAKHKCLFCDYTSNSQSDVINHTKQHANEQPYQCTKCDKKFVSLGGLTDHELVHLPPRYLCFTCGKVFAEKSILKNHLEVHRGKQLCAQCGKEYSGEDYFCHTEVVSALCKKCGIRFEYLCQYEKHKRMHEEVVEKMKYRGKRLCIHCGKDYSAKDYIFHKELVDEVSPCKICGLHFDYICMYEKHKKEHIEALENIKTCRTQADLCQYIECTEMVVSQAPLIYGYNHVCMICGKRFKDFPSTLVHIERHVESKSGMTRSVASSVCKTSREPVNDFQGFDKHLNSNMKSNLIAKQLDIVAVVNATKMKESRLESDMQLSLKPQEEALKYNLKEDIALKVNRNYRSVNLSARSLPHSSYDSQVHENLPSSPSKGIEKKVILSGYSLSSNEGGSVTKVDHGLTFSKYKAVMAEISQKNLETGESKMKQPLIEPCSLEIVCPLVSSTLGDVATYKSSIVVKSPIASRGKCGSDNLSRCRLILSDEKPSSNNEERVNSPKDRISLYKTETKALNKKERDVPEDICGEVVKDESYCVPSFQSAPRDSSKHREDFKSFDPFMNNPMVGDLSLEHFHSCSNDSQIDTENKVVNQGTNVKKDIRLPSCKDGKVEGMHRTQTALSDNTVNVVSLEKSFSGTVSQGITNKDSSFVENTSIEESRTLGVNSEKNHSSRIREKYNVENKPEFAGQSYMSSLANSLEASNCSGSAVVKDLLPNKKTIQKSGKPQVKVERRCLSRKRKLGKMQGRNAHKKCPSCGIMVLCKLSTHAKTCFKKQEEDCLQQSEMSLENSRNIVPLSIKLENRNISISDVKNQLSENVGDDCGRNGTIAGNGCDLKNVNVSKGILKRTIKNTRESDKLQYVCKEISSKSYLKDNPYCTLCGKVFTVKSAFEAHKQLHENAGWYLCYKCGIAYRNERNLVRHCEITHFGEYVFEFEQEKLVPVRKTGSFSNKLIRKNVPKQYGDSQTDVYDKSGHFECRHCRQIFRCKSVLKLHLESHKKICLDEEFKLIEIQCSICNMKFIDRRRLKLHWQSHKNSQLFTCIVCEKAFSAEDEFLYHKCMKVKHGNFLKEKYVSHENQNVTVDAGGEMDEESTSSNNSSKKKLVGKVESGFSCQAEVKNKNKLYKCPVCRRRFESREVFAAHVVKHEKSKWYICVDCSLCFWLKEGLKEHSMYAHSEHWVTDENTFEETNGSLVESEVKEFLCSVCGDKCLCQETFKQHILQHENDNWCICGDCGNCYRDRGNLLRHERQYHGKIHDDSLTSEKLKNSHGINRTVKVTLERMSPCNICGMYYGTSKTDLEKHLTTHVMQKKKIIFKCTLCLRTFKNMKLLLSHKILHSSQKQRSSISLREKNIVNPKKSSLFKFQDARLHKRVVYKKDIRIFKSSVGPLCSKNSHVHRNLLLRKNVKRTNLLYHRKKLLGSSAQKFVCLSCDSKFFFKISLDKHIKKYHRLGVILGSVSKDIFENVPD
ncbi:zinc finger protein Xfin-like [Macrobrachium rosenbergii]|uniref:zinc finger protein Xfin-like n=1 Tax=Macrobrachium rosenbergii TaxID=79674 RepID=UPI0034D5125A